MSKIIVLPQHLANQIAAGEVVERPASVIKELVENSIDAGASKILVEIELGGRRLMKITDDGGGIARSDAELAFKRHATSKLSSLDDLESIRTLGFRGEALASISAVAKVELLTKTPDEEIAVRVVSSAGELDVSDAARPDGTTIEVRDLFYNTPARRKFLRSQPTENYHIASIVTHYALANPDISFVLTNNGRESLRVTAARSLKERAYQIFGGQMIESLVPVNDDSGGFVSLSGFVSAPRERRTSRDSQYFFINGRYVKDKVISAGLSEGYRSVLPHGVYPVAFLFLELPPEEVDVNVHPSKTEVRFRRAEAVKEVVASAVKRSLGNAGIGKEAIADEQSSRGFAVAPSEDSFEAFSQSSAAAVSARTETPFDLQTGFDDAVFTPSHATENEAPQNVSETFETKTSPEFRPAANPAGYDVLPPVDSAYSIPDSIEPDDLDVSKIRPIGQLHDSFIIASDDEGLLLIDQHVAHERILFDYFRKRESDRQIESQILLIPETLDLSPAQAEVFSELREELEAFGFRIAEMSGRTVAIQSVPSDLPAGEANNLFSEILETIDTTKMGDADRTVRDDIAASLACRAAVKINMKLTKEKMRWMIENLLATTSPTTCPHGRPVILRLTLKDIERRFHRT